MVTGYSLAAVLRAVYFEAFLASGRYLSRPEVEDQLVNLVRKPKWHLIVDQGDETTGVPTNIKGFVALEDNRDRVVDAL